MTGDVLVVDDEADIRDLVAAILQDDGYQVRTARDSETALSAIRARKPSLIVLDIWMTGGGIRMEFGTPSLPWAATFQMEGIFTRYLDDLYITSRTALFGDLSLEATFP